MELVPAQLFTLRLPASGSLLTNLDADWWRYLRNSRSDSSAGSPLARRTFAAALLLIRTSVLSSLTRTRPTKTTQRERCVCKKGFDDLRWSVKCDQGNVTDEVRSVSP